MPNADYLSHLSTGPVFPGVIQRRDVQHQAGWTPTWVAIWGSSETPCASYDAAHQHLLARKAAQ